MKELSGKYLTIFMYALISSILIVSCVKTESGEGKIKRFETDLFKEISGPAITKIDSLRSNYPEFLPIFCTEIIGIGNDTTTTAALQINEFINDPIIKQVYFKADSIYKDFDQLARKIIAGINRFGKLTSGETDIDIISYISGFNQSFVSLPGVLGVGIDNYLGAETEYYSQLAIPRYLRQKMDPDYIVIDAVRAWIISEMPQGKDMKTLLDHMVYEGIILYYLKQSLPREEEHKIFRYSEQQLEWCELYEKSMWEYILKNEILYSTDRIMISRLTKEGPFVREFGQESPGRAGSWIGFRIVERYMNRKVGKSLKPDELPEAKTILAESRYSPG